MKKFIPILFLVCRVYGQMPSTTFEGTWPANPYNSAPDPAGWLSTNVLTSPFISSSNPTTTTQHTLACEGNASMRIETKTFVTTGLLASYIPTVAGFAFTGYIQISPSFALRDGFPFTSRPNYITYCYIAQPQPQDTAGVRVLLWKYTGSSRNYIGFAEITYTASNSSFITQTLNIAYNSTVTPDSAGIYVASSFKYPSSGFVIRDGAKAGSIFILDNIQFGPTGLSDYESSTHISLFPNPAHDILYIKTDNIIPKKAHLMDITGKCYAVRNFREQTLFDTSGLPSGLYFVKITDDNGRIISTRKVMISHP
jgi:hypothetical protein